MFDNVANIGVSGYNMVQFRAAQSKQQKHYIIYEYKYEYNRGNLHTYVHHIRNHN